MLKTLFHSGMFWAIAITACFQTGLAFEGTVRRVIDGDTVEVVPLTGGAEVYRLLGAAAPDKGQPGFGKSKKQLRDWLGGQKVSVEPLPKKLCGTGGDPGCVRLAKVYFRNEDAALRQVARGWAWHDIRQIREQSTTDRTLYDDAEVQANRKRYGLWAAKNPIPPWEFGRKRSKQYSRPKASPY